MDENIPKYDPDEIIPNKNSLPYPVQIGDQKITPIDNTFLKKRGLVNLEHYYQTKLNEIIEEYQELVEDFKINERVYNSKFSWEPIIGHIYHLYKNSQGEEFLSLITPNDWSYKHLGSFKYNSDHRWEKVDL